MAHGRLPLPCPLLSIVSPCPAPFLPLQGSAVSSGVCLSPLLALFSPSRVRAPAGSVSVSVTFPQCALSPGFTFSGPIHLAPVLRPSPLTFPHSHLSSQHLLSRDPLAWSEWPGSIPQAKPLNLSDPLLNCLCSLAKNQLTSGLAEVCLQALASNSYLLCSVRALASHPLYPALLLPPSIHVHGAPTV